MKQGYSFAILIFLFATLLISCRGKDDGIPPPATLTSIAVTPGDPSLAPGTTTQLTAIGTYSNNNKRYLTSSVVWASSDTGIATIGNSPGSQGLVTATSTIGSTIITAAFGGITGATTLTTAHVASMSVSPPAPPSIAPLTTLQFTAIGTLSDINGTQQDLTTFATWTSADPLVANVSNASGSKGLASAVSAVTAATTIAALYDGISGTATFQISPLVSIALAPLSASIAKGTTQQFTATGTLADSTPQILTAVATWSSSSTGIATISSAAGSQGLATAVSVGTTSVLAQFSGITSSPSATLTVTPAVITSITVTPTNPSIVLGTTQQFIAMATFSDNTTQDISSTVTWNSSNTSIATVSNTSGSKGLATSVNVGSTTITATSGGFSGSTSLTVTQAVLTSIDIIPASASISTIGTQFFTAMGTDSSGTPQNLTTQVTWISSDPTIATISNVPGSQGRASWGFINIGTVTITATFGGITSTPATLTVHF